MSEPQDLLITMSALLSNSVAKSTITLEESISQMKLSGMDVNQIKSVLMNDLNNGGRIFGSYKNAIKMTTKNGVGYNSNIASQKVYQDSSVEEFQWVGISDKRVCEDCEDRHGQTGTMEYFRTVGLPRSGFSICQTNCRCQLVPMNYKGENIEEPIITKKDLPITAFKMAGKHKTSKDSIEWLRTNIADRVSISSTIDVGIMNEITKSLARNFEKYKLSKLEKIYFNRGNAWASASGGTLSINKKIFNKKGMQEAYKKTVTEYTSKYKKWIKEIEDDLKPLLSKPFAELSSFEKRMIQWNTNRIIDLKKTLESRQKYNYHNYLNKKKLYGSIIDHEIGHMIHDQYTGKLNGSRFRKKSVSKEIADKWNKEWISIYRKSKNQGLIYNISEYASADHYELFAESFSMYVNGKKLPEIIKDYLDRYLTSKELI
jgi:hypothetical protein